jgi:hypothetical protein
MLADVLLKLIVWISEAPGRPLAQNNQQVLNDIRIQLEQIHRTLTDNVNFLQSLTHIVSIVGLPIAVLVFYSKYRKEQEARAEEIYQTLDDLWVNFNSLLLRYPNLDAAYVTFEPRTLTPEEKVQQYVIFDVLTTMFERAYLAYLRASKGQRTQQWRGWEAYIDHYCKKQSYRDWWFLPVHSAGPTSQAIHDSQYDVRFEKYMMQKFDAARKAKA